MTDTIATGKIQITVGDLDGMVVLAFERAYSKVVLDPEGARQIGEQLQRSAYAASFGAEPASRAPMLKQHTRNTLINRFIVVDRSLREQGRTPAVIAQTLVDLFLSEVS